MFMSKVVLTLLLGFVSSGATASLTYKWTKVYDDGVETTYADLTTISHEPLANLIKTYSDDSIVQMWTLSAKNKHNFEDKFSSIQLRYEFDCKDSIARKLVYLTYSENMAKGKMVSYLNGRLTTDPSMRWYPILTGSKIEKLSKVACKKYKLHKS